MFLTRSRLSQDVDTDGAMAADEERSWSGTGTGALDEDSAKFLYRWGGQLSAALVRVRSRFDGDLDQYLLFLVFVLAELSQSMATGSSRQRRGLNALSLSEITQIPRETARRKLRTLADHGYLERDAEGLYVLGDRYGVDQFFSELQPLFQDASRGGR